VIELNETIERVEQKHIDTEGLVLIAKSSSYEIWDDRENDRALVHYIKYTLIETDEGKKRIEEYRTISIPRPRRKLEWKVLEYVLDSLRGYSSLIPFVLQNKSLMKLAEYLFRRSRSRLSIRVYASIIKRFCDYAGKSADDLILECLDEGIPNQRKVYEASKLIDEFLGELDAENLASSTLLVHGSRIRTFYKINGIDVMLPKRYSSKVKYRDRAPTPEEIQRMIEVADLRERAIIAMLATSGLRIGTLLKLKYRHVKEDLEAGRVPVHIHVEADLTKGKYCDYDTFINEEAAHYLKLYLNSLPKPINDEDPLFRKKKDPSKPASYRGVYNTLCRVFERAGLGKRRGKGNRKMREIRVHSLRKFFRTQLGAKVKDDHVEYMMGHKLSTYNDVERLGVDYLRAEYAKAGLRIFPKQGIDEKKAALLAIKKIAEQAGLDLKRIPEYLSSGRTALEDQDIDKQIDMYAKAIWYALRRDLRLNYTKKDSIKEKTTTKRVYQKSNSKERAPREEIREEIRDIALILAKELSNALKHEFGSK